MLASPSFVDRMSSHSHPFAQANDPDQVAEKVMRRVEIAKVRKLYRPPDTSKETDDFLGCPKPS